MIIPLLRIIFNSSTAVFEKTISSYNGDFSWTKDGVLSFVNYYLAKHAISEGRYSTLILICIFLVIMVFLKNMFTFLSTFFPLRFSSKFSKKITGKNVSKNTNPTHVFLFR
jgi:subfamily B ATP-binding cassette protein MsbA